MGFLFLSFFSCILLNCVTKISYSENLRLQPAFFRLSYNKDLLQNHYFGRFIIQKWLFLDCFPAYKKYICEKRKFGKDKKPVKCKGLTRKRPRNYKRFC